MPEPVSEAARILGERLRDRRIELAISQEQVAHLAAINVSNYGKVERGLGNPEFHTLVRLASVLNLDPGKLIEGIPGDALPDRPRIFTVQDFVRERSQRN